MTKLHQTEQDNTLTNSGSRILLLLSCSPRKGKHTFELLRNAALALKEYPSLNSHLETLAEKKIFPCHNCFYHCSQEGHCWQDDDFEAVAQLWLNADGIILGSPVYSFGPPSTVTAFFERLQALQKANPTSYTSSHWPQSVGIVVQGGSEYSGAEICAQTLLSLCSSVGCVPISGDMPGFSQGIIGQIRNNEEISEHLLEGVRRLASRVVEFVEILSAGQNPEPVPLRFLIVKAGMPEEALVDALDSYSLDRQILNNSIEWRLFDFNNVYISPCLSCTEYCSRDQECRFTDGMQTFRSEWLTADTVFWLAGHGTGSSFASLRAAIDRMNQIRFETFFACGYRHMPRYLKVSVPFGHVTGSAEPDSTMLFLRHVSLLYQNILLPQIPECQMRGSAGVHSTSSASGFVSPDLNILTSIDRSAQLAIMIKSGLSRLSDSLPEEYFPSKSHFAQVDTTNITAGKANSSRDSDYPPVLA